MRISKRQEILNKTKSDLDKAIEWLRSSGAESTGITLTKDRVFQVAAAYQAVNIISGQIATLPCPVYKRDKVKGRQKDSEHPAYNLLNVKFNDYLTAYQGWRIFMANCLISSAGYIYIERKNGVPKNLYPINSDRVTKKINLKTGKPEYQIKWTETDLTIVTAANMIEVQGLSLDFSEQNEPIKLLKNILGLTINVEAYGNEFFKNGLHPSGIFTMDGHLDDDRLKKFKKEINDVYTGLGKRHKAMLLEDGMKFNKISAPPEEGQMTETRKFQVVEIARFFNIPPTKLFELDRATWSNIEELNIQFVQETITPWVVAIQQELNRQLLLLSEEKTHYIEFNLGGLLRGKMADRYNSYAQGRQWGFLSVNEIRELENMSNIGEQGNIYLTPSNMMNSDGITTVEYETKKTEEEKDAGK